jgi:hypothetical protein
MIKTIAAMTLVAGAVIVSPPDAAPVQDDADAEQSTLNQAAPDHRERLVVPEVGREDRRRTRQLSPEMIQRCLEVAHDVDPALAEHLEQLRQTRGEPAFGRSIRRARHLVGLARLKERNPQLYDVKVQELKVDAKVTRTLETIQEARREGRSVGVLEHELHELVRQQVSLSIASRGMYLQTLQEHVKGMQERLEKEATSFHKTVEKRYAKLLKELEAELEAEPKAEPPAKPTAEGTPVEAG